MKKRVLGTNKRLHIPHEAYRKILLEWGKIKSDMGERLRGVRQQKEWTKKGI